MSEPSYEDEPDVSINIHKKRDGGYGITCTQKERGPIVASIVTTVEAGSEAEKAGVLCGERTRGVASLVSRVHSSWCGPRCPRPAPPESAGPGRPPSGVVVFSNISTHSYQFSHVSTYRMSRGDSPALLCGVFRNALSVPLSRGQKHHTPRGSVRGNAVPAHGRSFAVLDSFPSVLRVLLARRRGPALAAARGCEADERGPQNEILRDNKFKREMWSSMCKGL